MKKHAHANDVDGFCGAISYYAGIEEYILTGWVERVNSLGWVSQRTCLCCPLGRFPKIWIDHESSSGAALLNRMHGSLSDYTLDCNQRSANSNWMTSPTYPTGSSGTVMKVILGNTQVIFWALLLDPSMSLRSMMFDSPIQDGWPCRNLHRQTISSTIPWTSCTCLCVSISIYSGKMINLVQDFSVDRKVLFYT